MVTLATSNKRLCYSLIFIGLVILIVSIYMFSHTYVFIGVEVPVWLRKPISILGAIMGLHFVYGGLKRLFSKDAAIAIDHQLILFHVNPGRRLTLDSKDIIDIGMVVAASNKIEGFIVGKQKFLIRTNMPEGIMSSSIVVGDKMIEESLEKVRQQLLDALTNNSDKNYISSGGNSD